MSKLAKAFGKFFSAGEKGFTLVELLVVVAILGTLAGVVALNVTGFLGQGETEACETEVDIVQAAVVAYMADNDGAVPADTAALITAGLLMKTPDHAMAIDAAGLVTSTDCP